jgi:hypothetical protein
MIVVISYQKRCGCLAAWQIPAPAARTLLRWLNSFVFAMQKIMMIDRFGTAVEADCDKRTLAFMEMSGSA